MKQPREPKGQSDGGRFAASCNPESSIDLTDHDDAIPSRVLAVLPGDTAATWVTIAPLLPESAYLIGGTALTVHLQHRVSRDLDFFLEQREDIGALWLVLQSAGKAMADIQSEDTLNCLFNNTKLQVLEATTQRLIRPTTSLAGIRIASVEDIMATKINVIRQRSALRDYFDLMCIEQQAGIQAEVGIALAVQKYNPQNKDMFAITAMKALGNFDDVADDPGLPVNRKEIESYWERRQYEVVKRFDSFGGMI